MASNPLHLAEEGAANGQAKSYPAAKQVNVCGLSARIR